MPSFSNISRPYTPWCGGCGRFPTKELCAACAGAPQEAVPPLGDCDCEICFDSPACHAVSCTHRCKKPVCATCAVRIMNESDGRCPFCRGFVEAYLPPLSETAARDIRDRRCAVEMPADLIARFDEGVRRGVQAIESFTLDLQRSIGALERFRPEIESMLVHIDNMFPRD